MLEKERLCLIDGFIKSLAESQKQLFSIKIMQNEILPLLLKFVKRRGKNCENEKGQKDWSSLLSSLSKLVPKLVVLQKWKFSEKDNQFVNISFSSPLSFQRDSSSSLIFENEEQKKASREFSEILSEKQTDSPQEEGKEEREEEGGESNKEKESKKTKRELKENSVHDICYQISVFFLFPPSRKEVFKQALILYIKTSVEQLNLLPSSLSYLAQFVLHLTQLADLDKLEQQRLQIYLDVLDLIFLIYQKEQSRQVVFHYKYHLIELLSNFLFQKLYFHSSRYPLLYQKVLDLLTLLFSVSKNKKKSLLPSSSPLQQGEEGEEQEQEEGLSEKEDIINIVEFLQNAFYQIQLQYNRSLEKNRNSSNKLKQLENILRFLSSLSTTLPLALVNLYFFHHLLFFCIFYSKFIYFSLFIIFYFLYFILYFFHHLLFFFIYFYILFFIYFYI